MCSEFFLLQSCHKAERIIDADCFLAKPIAFVKLFELGLCLLLCQHDATSHFGYSLFEICCHFGVSAATQGSIFRHHADDDKIVERAEDA